MKYFLLAVLLAFANHLHSQQIYIRLFSANVKDGVDFVLHDTPKNTNKKIRCSYAVLKSADIRFMTYWGVGGDNNIYWTNSENIYKLNAANGSSKLVASKLASILELAVRGDYAYVAYNPENRKTDFDGRYAPGVKLIRIHLASGKREEIKLPKNTNITNLTVSKDGQRLSFIDIKNYNKKNRTEYLKIYEVKSRQVKSVDSARTAKSEWFVNADRLNTASWAHAQSLVYYKYVKQHTNGSMYAYDFALKKHKKLIDNVPQVDFLWFAYYYSKYYFSNRNTLYSTADGKTKKTVYTVKNDNILEAIVL